MATGSNLLQPKLKDKVAIVTGGCLGIGRGCVDAFVEQGAKVVVFDIEDEEGAKMTATSPNNVGGEIYYIRCDVRDEQNIKKAIESAVEKYGRIDSLVNNAGTHPPSKTIDEFSSDDFRQLFDLNLMSVFLCCKYALPYLRKNKGSSITNIASVAGGYGQDEAVTYCATKGGVIAFSKGLALDEGKHGVRVNAISPGATLTPMYKAWADTQGEYSDLEAVLKEASTYNILRRIGDPREIGEAALFLATGGTYVTGIDMTVSGGMEVGYGKRL